jgi:dTDP-L-rhamnose 4-epimerase
MSVYGEGLYRNPAGELANGLDRTTDQLKQQEWEIRNAAGERLAPIPTPETKQCSLASFYALSKFDQEQLSLLFGRTYRVPTVALRFFNVYGPRQSLSNPYTGVLAIFASRLLNNNRPLIFEDGLQRRDFVNVSDVARACRLALEASSATSVFNIGSGQSTTILEIAQEMARVIGRSDLQPLINGEYRKGDIRHCFADISLARNILEFEPRVIFAQGITELAEWLATQVAIDRVSEHRAELVARGLTI